MRARAMVTIRGFAGFSNTATREFASTPHNETQSSIGIGLARSNAVGGENTQLDDADLELLYQC